MVAERFGKLNEDEQTKLHLMLFENTLVALEAMHGMMDLCLFIGRVPLLRRGKARVFIAQVNTELEWVRNLKMLTAHQQFSASDLNDLDRSTSKANAAMKSFRDLMR